MDLTVPHAALNRWIIDSAFDFAIIATDLDGQVTTLNEGAHQILGWAEDEMIGQPIDRFFTPEDIASGQVAHEMEQALATGIGTDERWHQRRGGERFWASGQMTVLRDDAGAAVGFVKVLRDTTERRLATETLRGTQTNIRLLLDSMAEGFYAVDRTGVTTVVNAAFLRMMGFAREEDAVGRKLHDIIHGRHPDGSHYAVADCPIYQCAQDGTPAHVTDEFFFPIGGEPLPVEYWAIPIHSDGELQGAICTFLDVTDRRRAEEARNTSEEALRALNADLERQVVERSSERARLWQVSPDLLSVIDLATGRVDRVNPAWTKALGWTPDEVDGQPYERFVHPEDLHASTAAFARARAGEPVLRFENRYRTNNGDWRWLSWVAVPEGGKLYSTTRDITDEKAGAEALAIATAERDLMWQTSPDLLVVLDFDGVFRRVNPAWTTILGFAEHELIGTRVDRLVHPDDVDLTEEALASAADGPLPTVENRYRHKEGGYRWISWITPPPEGGLIYATGRHITAEKEREAELEAAREALRQSQKMEAVGQLTGGLAHDFNNLLTGMMGNLELLQMRVARGRLDDLDRFVNAAQGGGRRAAALTQRLLAFSRRQTLDPKPTDVNRLIAGLEELLRRTVGANTDIEIVQAAGLWTADIDTGQLENAVLNLCINGRDAMPGGGKLTIETANKWMDDRSGRERDLPPGQYISICVTDTGSGMTPETIARAFEPFYTTKPLGRGTGLGLSRIYGFAKQSGGQVRIYSEVGSGTTVCIYLPRYHGEAEDIDAADAAGLTQSTDAQTVLVVDDEATIRHLIDEVLDELGYTVIGAADGAAGLKVLQSGARIELLITDVGLPNGMNGRQVADEARRLRPGLKVLFITGFAENAAVGNGHLEPGMELLTKPFTLEALSTKVADMLARPSEAGS